MRITIHAFEDPAVAGEDWPEQWADIESDWKRHLDAFPDEALEFRLHENYQQLGTEIPTLLVDILKIGGIAISIPAAHKLIRETVSEWRKIFKNLRRVFDWIRQKEKINSYSMQVAFIWALAHLEEIAEVDGLELISATEVPGATTSPEPSFESVALLYYVFVFKDNGRNVFLLAYDSRLNLVAESRHPLDPRSLAAGGGP